MAVRRPEGAALLVAGYGASGVGAFDASAVHTLGQIGEALLATGTPWQIRRLTASAGDRFPADRATLKRSLDELAADPVRVAVIVLLGEIALVNGNLALVTGAQAREYPEDATLPLAWIRERLIGAKAEHVVVAISARGDGDASRWLGALGTERPNHVIAIDTPSKGNPIVDALLTGLCGDALDPRTGTVTMASLSTHLARHARSVQPSSASETVAQPPPLAGLWDVRRSQLTHHAAKPRATDQEDLAGVVLPGRFRIDRVVARGTFGTVYRARQLAVERDVAVKVLHADIDPSSEDGRLFVHEIRSVGRIDHANVVRIYQADITHDGRLFFAMELLDGSDLQQLGTDGKLSRARAVELVRQLLAGLGAAHDAGLVHADIKPANAIVVSRSRKPAGTPPRPVDSVRAGLGSDASARPVEAAADAGLADTIVVPRSRPAESGNGSADTSATPHDDAPPEERDERVVLVDFGLARLRAPDRPAESAGGTPAYMAPEQLHEGRVDARSDLFSAALVLVWLMTGWRRPNAFTLVPPPDTIAADDLRAVLAKALDPDPAKRYQTAGELAAAFTGGGPPPKPTTQPTPILPFRHLAPLTEADRGRLHGREADLAVITENVLYRRAVIYTAPSGTGKTSMLRAGLLPRLEALGIRAVYVRCRNDCTAAVIAEIAPGATSIADAITSFHKHRGGKLVVVIDQLEAALADPDFVPAILGFDRWPRDADVSILLSIREDYLARLLARTQELEPNIPLVRLPPLSLDGARAAIVAPLTEARLAIEPELLDALLADLQRAAAAIGPEMGWGTAPAVFAPHLQLACSVLYENLGPDDATLSLAHYRRLGGFDAIVGEHLDRVIETELAGGRDLIARDLFVALVTTAHERAIRPESELLSIVGEKHGAANVIGVLEILRSRGFLVRVRGDDEPSWELVHDSLVPRVLAWIDRKDLARRRAVELVRYHLRRSRPDAPSLLGRAELREIRRHRNAIDELDAEWKKREGDEGGWTPTRLVTRSKQVIRRRTVFFSTVLVAAIAVGGLGMYKSYVEEARAREQASLRDRDLGRFTLSLESFDWDPVALRAIPMSSQGLGWELHLPDPADLTQPGPPFPDHLLVRGERHLEGKALVEEIEARGGASFLVVTRAGCAPSIVPLRKLPGYTQRDHVAPVIRIRVPTCQVSNVHAIPIPAGPFMFGGAGEPPSPESLEDPSLPREQRIVLPAFRMDRTEVTNAAFNVFADMAPITGIPRPVYPSMYELAAADGPRKPVGGIDWAEARSYCRFLGASLPTHQQWLRALRGGDLLPNGESNPWPRRNFPWAPASPFSPAKLKGMGEPGPADVASFPADRSAEGVFDLAGNVSEWIATLPREVSGLRAILGGNVFDTDLEALPVYMASGNIRPTSLKYFGIGVRCASTP